MTHALGWDEGGSVIAPFYVDLETPVPESGVPKPGPLSVHLKDDHLQYAITWFTLAFAVVIAFAVWVARTAPRLSFSVFERDWWHEPLFSTVVNSTRVQGWASQCRLTIAIYHRPPQRSG